MPACIKKAMFQIVYKMAINPSIKINYQLRVRKGRNSRIATDSFT